MLNMVWPKLPCNIQSFLNLLPVPPLHLTISTNSRSWDERSAYSLLPNRLQAHFLLLLSLRLPFSSCLWEVLWIKFLHTQEMLSCDSSSTLAQLVAPSLIFYHHLKLLHFKNLESDHLPRQIFSLLCSKYCVAQGTIKNVSQSRPDGAWFLSFHPSYFSFL